MDPTAKRPRLWPALAVASCAAAAILVLWTIPEMQRQQRYIRSAIVLFGAGFLLVVWWLFFSRVRWRVRLIGFALVVATIAVASFSLEIRGVDGDLLPIVQPRWKKRHAIAPDAPARLATNRVQATAEFPQFYGPERNGIIRGVTLETNWNAFPPEQRWKISVGPAWSGFVVKEGLAITMEQREQLECVIAYNLLNGETAWIHTNAARYATTIAGEGPRSTPTLAGERVLSFGATGILSCLELQSGRLIWEKNIAQDVGARLPDWGFTSSPLVSGERVIVSVGGSEGRAVVAYSLKDGTQIWASGEGGSDYSSPIEATLLGEKQILLFAHRVVGRDLNGKVLWTYPWPGGHPHISTPLVISSNRLFVSSGYGTGCELLELGRPAPGAWQATRIWKTLALKSKFGPLFHIGDYVYGLDDGIFCCVDLQNGERKWKDGRYGHGQGLLVGDRILLTSEKGELVLIQPDPEKLIELCRLKVFTDKTWNPPALAGDFLLIRNDREAACLRLKTTGLLR